MSSRRDKIKDRLRRGGLAGRSTVLQRSLTTPKSPDTGGIPGMPGLPALPGPGLSGLGQGAGPGPGPGPGGAEARATKAKVRAVRRGKTGRPGRPKGIRSLLPSPSLAPLPVSGRRGLPTLPTLPTYPTAELEKDASQPDRRQQIAMIRAAGESVDQLPTYAVDAVDYSFYSYDEMKRIAEVKLTVPEGKGLRSINDPRMGSHDTEQVCEVCTQRSQTCPGHYGLIDFAIPIINPVPVSTVIKVLETVDDDGDMLLGEQKLADLNLDDITYDNRLNAIADASRGKGSRYYLRGGSKDTGLIYYKLSTKDVEVYVLPNDKVFDILDKINSRTAAVLGFESPAHPRDLMMRALLVVPPCARPSAMLDGQVLQDTLDLAYNDIIRVNENIKTLLAEQQDRGGREPGSREVPEEELEEEGQERGEGEEGEEGEEGGPEEGEEPEQDDGPEPLVPPPPEGARTVTEIFMQDKPLDKALSKLFYYVKHVFSNTKQEYEPARGGPILSIQERLSGKRGLIRSNIMGKRTNFTARSVLGPDPNLKFGQIRVPRSFARTLTRPITVTPENITVMNGLYQTGKVVHLTKNSYRGFNRRLEVTAKIISAYPRLRIGDLAERELMNGDYIMFNRQPTIHRFSFMGYEVVLGDELTIGLHLAMTQPHNADFDGDEGNIHAPQSDLVDMEIRTILNIRNNITGPESNAPIVGAVMDVAAGVYHMTMKPRDIDVDVFFDNLMLLTNKDSLATLDDRLEKYSVPKFSGRGLFSSFLPPDLYYFYRDKDKGDVVIKEGILISGTITTAHVGSRQGSIIHVIAKEMGNERAADFVSDLYFVATRYMETIGASVGMSDVMLGESEVTRPRSEFDDKIERMSFREAPMDFTIKRAMAKVIKSVESMGYPLANPIEEEKREGQIKAYLNTAEGEIGRAVKALTPANNAFTFMASSGAKGSSFNMIQSAGALTQQYIGGERPAMSQTGMARTLPYLILNL